MSKIELIEKLQATMNMQEENVSCFGFVAITADLAKSLISSLKSEEITTFDNLKEYVEHAEMLTPTEYDLLSVLVEANGRPVKYGDLNHYADIKSGCNGNSTASLHTHKCRLARKLRPEFSIGTVRRNGYILVRKAAA